MSAQDEIYCISCYKKTDVNEYNSKYLMCRPCNSDRIGAEVADSVERWNKLQDAKYESEMEGKRGFFRLFLVLIVLIILYTFLK